MTQRMMVRSLSVALLGLALLATPAFAAGPERPADSARSGWTVEFGDLVSRVVGLLFDDWAGDRSALRETEPTDDGIQKMSGQDEGGANLDPNG